MRNIPNKIKYISTLLFIFTFLSTFLVLYITTNEALGNTEGLVLFYEPRNPVPDESVTFKITYFQSDIRKAVVSWYKNGTLEKTGLGLTSFSTLMAPVGNSTNIRATITTIDGKTISESVIISPGDIDLLWEANTTVPAFYKGKALAPQMGEVTVVAIPNFTLSNGRKINESALIYEWLIDGRPSPANSGPGKNTIKATTKPFGSTISITAIVRDTSNTIRGEKTINLGGVSPEIHLYEERPLLGPLFNNQLKNSVELMGSEITVRAEPYYFSNNIRRNFEWKLGSTKTSPHTANRKLLTLVLPPGLSSQSGSTLVHLTISAVGNQFQRASSLLEILF